MMPSFQTCLVYHRGIPSIQLDENTQNQEGLAVQDYYLDPKGHFRQLHPEVYETSQTTVYGSYYSSPWLPLPWGISDSL